MTSATTDSTPAAPASGARATGTSPAPTREQASAATGTAAILVYSSQAPTRAQVIAALGTRPAPDLPTMNITECATPELLWRTLRNGSTDSRHERGFDLVILDGEARPAGGLGICRQMKDEFPDCPPVLVLIGRADDRWLASWSQADAAVQHPLDPMLVATTAADLLRAQLAHQEQRRAG